MSRPSWDEVAIAIAVAASPRGECVRRRVGAVVMAPDNSILAVGVNGVPAGQPSCLDGACPRGNSNVDPGSSYDTGPGTCIANHAEASALLRSDPVRRQGGTVAVSTEPCDGCMRLMRASGVARVLWPDGEVSL